MSDDLVERLRDFDPHLHEWEVVDEAADRIEALTAERDRAYASGYSDAETEISTSALGQRNTFLHSQYANAADHIKALTAERDANGKDYNTLKVWYRQVRQDNARLRAVLDLDPWFVGREAWKNYTDIALKEDNHE
jgi:hypothetical protein